MIVHTKTTFHNKQFEKNKGRNDLFSTKNYIIFFISSNIVGRLFRFVFLQSNSTFIEILNFMPCWLRPRIINFHLKSPIRLPLQFGYLTFISTKNLTKTILCLWKEKYKHTCRSYRFHDMILRTICIYKFRITGEDI